QGVTERIAAAVEATVRAGQQHDRLDAGQLVGAESYARRIIALQPELVVAALAVEHVAGAEVTATEVETVDLLPAGDGVVAGTPVSEERAVRFSGAVEGHVLAGTQGIPVDGEQLPRADIGIDGGQIVAVTVACGIAEACIVAGQQHERLDVDEVARSERQRVVALQTDLVVRPGA